MEEKMLADLKEFFKGSVMEYDRYGYNKGTSVDIADATSFDIEAETFSGGGCETCWYEWHQTMITFYGPNGKIVWTEFDFTEFLTFVYEKVDN